jgi:hypothetical protein
VKRRADVVCRRIGDTAVLVDMATNLIFELNATGYRVWELLGEGLDRPSLDERLAREFDVDRQQLDRDVTELLTRLRDERLITDNDEYAGPGKG